MELATDAAAPGGDWTWRLSVADVPSRAEFSLFPGVDRLIACLAGPGLKLENAGASVSVPSEGEALAFAGEAPVAGAPLGPGVRDVNLMLRRDRWRGRMVLARERTVKLQGEVVLVYAPEGLPSIRVDSDEGVLELDPGGLLIVGGRAVVLKAPGGIAVACELSPV